MVTGNERWSYFSNISTIKWRRRRLQFQDEPKGKVKKKKLYLLLECTCLHNLGYKWLLYQMQSKSPCPCPQNINFKTFTIVDLLAFIIGSNYDDLDITLLHRRTIASGSWQGNYSRLIWVQRPHEELYDCLISVVCWSFTVDLLRNVSIKSDLHMVNC